MRGGGGGVSFSDIRVAYLFVCPFSSDGVDGV